MRAILAGLVLALGLASAPARADDSIAQVIRDQIAAFQSDDFATAFTFASPTIRQLFGSPERFGQMVQQGYPMVHRPADVTMLEQTDLGSATLQRVLIRDGQGRAHVLEYQMVPGPDGGWLINGVQFVQAPQTGV